MEHVVLAQRSILLLRSHRQMKCTSEGVCMAPSCPAQCSHYASHSLAHSPCQQLPWQPQPMARTRFFTEQGGKGMMEPKKRELCHLNNYI